MLGLLIDQAEQVDVPVERVAHGVGLAGEKCPETIAARPRVRDIDRIARLVQRGGGQRQRERAFIIRLSAQKRHQGPGDAPRLPEGRTQPRVAQAARRILRGRHVHAHRDAMDAPRRDAEPLVCCGFAG